MDKECQIVENQFGKKCFGKISFVGMLRKCDYACAQR